MASPRRRPPTSVLVATMVAGGALRALGCGNAASTDDQGVLLPQRDNDAESSKTDSGAGDAAVTDANDEAAIIDAGPCDPSAKFTTIVPVSAMNTPADESLVQLRANESMAFVARSGNVVFYDQSAAGFDGGTGVVIGGGNGDSLRMTDDLLTVYYHQFLGGGVTASRLFVTTRASTGAAFGGGNQIDLGASVGESDVEAFFLPNQQTLYFTTTRVGGKGQIFVTRKAGNSFGAPTAVPGMVSAANDRRAVVSTDEHVIYFASDRVAGGKQNVFRGVRADATSPFVLTEVTELSTTEDEYPTWLSQDYCRLYFVSERAGGTGNRDIWLASRKP